MSGLASREVRLVRHAQGPATTDLFEIAEAAAPPPEPGQVQVRNLWMSVDPYMINRLRDRASYVPPYRIGKPLDGGAVGVVVASAAEGFAPGDPVLSMYGWREAFTAKADRLRRLPGGLPLQAFLGVAGLTGMTAYVGLTRIGQLKPGQTLYVSGAAGAVGSAACQMGKLMGAQVIGSAGGLTKCTYLSEIGVDQVIDYKAEDLKAALKEAAPDGIDLYFDNVGGPQLEAAMDVMKPFGRMALCGMIAAYDGAPVSPPRNLFVLIEKRLTAQGFLVGDHEDLRPDFERDVQAWIADGRLTWRETVVDGLAEAPAALLSLLHGRNLGKMLVRLGEGA